MPTNRSGSTTKRRPVSWLPLGAGAVLLGGGALVAARRLGSRPLSRLLQAFPAGPIAVDQVVTVARSRQELYDTWRDLSSLPRILRHLDSVSVTGDGRSHWVTAAALGERVAWDAEIVRDEPGAVIAWRSLPGAAVPNRGEVRFDDAPAGRGTELRVSLVYEPPAGTLGAAFAKLFGEAPSQTLAEDLRRFKRLLEAGELVTTAGQPTGPGGRGRPVEHEARLLKRITEALDTVRMGARPSGPLAGSDRPVEPVEGTTR